MSGCTTARQERQPDLPTTTVHAVGDQVTITADVVWNGRHHQGWTGEVVELRPFDGGCGYFVQVTEGQAPVPVWDTEIQAVQP